MKKKKQTISPEAAKILEQYRNAGKAQPVPRRKGHARRAGRRTRGAARPERPARPEQHPAAQRSGK